MFQKLINNCRSDKIPLCGNFQLSNTSSFPINSRQTHKQSNKQTKSKETI